MIRELTEEEYMTLLMRGELLDSKHPFHINFGGFEMRYMFQPHPVGETYTIGRGYLYIYSFYVTGSIKTVSVVVNADALTVDWDVAVRILEGKEIYPCISQHGGYVYDYRGKDV